MPTRGYRKGVADDKEPLPRQVYTRTSTELHDRLQAEADSRSVPVSVVVRAVLEAHANQTRTQLPHPRGLTDDVLRQFVRIGNNLNQLARQANSGVVTVPAAELRQCLESLNRLARTL